VALSDWRLRLLYRSGRMGHLSLLPNSIEIPALALLLLPPPLVAALGFRIMRGFRPDYGKIDRHAATGVALTPVFVLIVLLDLMDWPPKDRYSFIGFIMIHALIAGAWYAWIVGLRAKRGS
jgi:hypothetical protein